MLGGGDHFLLSAHNLFHGFKEQRRYKKSLVAPLILGNEIT